MVTLAPQLRRRLKSGYFRALSAARVERVYRALHARRGRVLGLNLHRISPDENPYWPPLPPEAFRQLAETVARHARVVRFGDLPDVADDRRPLVVLSFDDGCRDFVEYAMPILGALGLPVNHNVIAGAVETGETPFAIAVPDALNAVGPDRVAQLRVPGFAVRLEGPDPLSCTRFGTALTAYLKGLSPTRREEVWAPVGELLREAGPAALTPMMRRADVEGAMAAGHEIGSHTWAHESAAHLDETQFAADWERCEPFFAGLGLPITVFAFPNNSFLAGQVEAVRARGVEHVLVNGRPSAARHGVHPRLPIYGDSAAELRLRALGVPGTGR